jgi:hypothetical protein
MSRYKPFEKGSELKTVFSSYKKYSLDCEKKEINFKISNYSK